MNLKILKSWGPAAIACLLVLVLWLMWPLWFGWDSAWQSLVAPVITGVVASLLAWSAVDSTLERRMHHARQEGVAYLRDLLEVHCRSLLQVRAIAAAELPPHMAKTFPNGFPEDALRAEVFNRMLRELGHAALDCKTLEPLSPREVKAVLDAVNWFQVPTSPDEVFAVSGPNGETIFPDVVSRHAPPTLLPVLREGRWMAEEMTKEQALERVEALQNLDWLGLPTLVPLGNHATASGVGTTMSPVREDWLERLQVSGWWDGFTLFGIGTGVGVVLAMLVHAP